MQQSDMRSRRDQYSVEIRNSSRNQLLQRKRQQQGTNYRLRFIEKVDVTQEMLQQAIEQLPKTPETSLEILKYLVDHKYPVYKEIRQMNILPILGNLLDHMDTYIQYLCFYHILNIVYEMDVNVLYSWEQLSQYLTLLKKKTIELYNADPNFGVFGLFALANLYSDRKVLQHDNNPIFIYNDILALVRIQGVSENCIHGLLWLTSNLSHLVSGYSLVVIDILNELAPKLTNDESIREDYVTTLSKTTRLMTEDEISDLFQSHVQLIVFILTHPFGMDLNLAVILRNLLYAQDDVIEQLLDMGLTEVLQRLLSSQDSDVLEETIGCLTNIFCAEDDEHIRQVLTQLNPVPQLLNALNIPSLLQEAAASLQQLLKNYPDICDQLIKMNTVQLTLQRLSDANIPINVANDLLGCLHALLAYDEQCNAYGMNMEGTVKQVLQNGGQHIICQYLDAGNEESASLVTQILGLCDF